ncbi:TATA-box binding protein (TBP), component of TFIID and TFIIIB [Methanoregula formicica SMSP]|uniref:TATA-box-binding protein n=2 Tax=Methanoregula formicica TaxID=882104 RepID=L0HDG9_METFS|nr:TATA-box binding protein (TBP), component of TFIID and TFIIIB [Methanoregula formicica SMSP]
MKKMQDDPIRIQNIVAAGPVADSIDLTHLLNAVPECRFDKKRFPGAVYYMQDPKAVALIFGSGKVVITGIARQEDLVPATKNLLAVLKTANIACHDEPRVSVRNIVCTCSFGRECNLVRMVASLMDSDWVEYEPESFPGLVCRLTDPKVVFLLFSSGKAVITGGTNLADIRKGLEIFREKLGRTGVL